MALGPSSPLASRAGDRRGPRPLRRQREPRESVTARPPEGPGNTAPGGEGLGPPGSGAALERGSDSGRAPRGRLQAAASSPWGAERAWPRPRRCSLASATADRDSGGRGRLGAACRARGTAPCARHSPAREAQPEGCTHGISSSPLSGSLVWGSLSSPFRGGGSQSLTTLRRLTKVSKPESGRDLRSASASGRVSALGHGACPASKAGSGPGHRLRHASVTSRHACVVCVCTRV